MFVTGVVGFSRFMNVLKGKKHILYGSIKIADSQPRRTLYASRSLCIRNRKRIDLCSIAVKSSPESHSVKVLKTEETGPQAEIVKHQLLQGKSSQLGDILPNDKLFKSILASQKVKKQRMKNSIILLEGRQLIDAAISSGLHMQYLFYSKECELSCLKISNLNEDKILKVRDKTLRLLSGSAISCGVLGICGKPAINKIASVLPVTILCSSIRDPSNLASIITTAVATGCKSICFTKGCADAWERKVLTLAGGAHFHIPIFSDIDWTNVKTYIPEGCAFYVADGSANIDLDDSQIYRDINYSEQTPNDDESITLNFLDGGYDKSAVRPNYSGEQVLQECVKYNLPCHLYCTEFPHQDIVLYIGGETGGIDSRIEQLASEIGGQKLKIPLENGMDSLNVCSALSIILFEIKRQFVKSSVIKCS